MAAKAKKNSLIKFEIKNRWTGDVQFTAEIAADENTAFGVKIGLAVKCLFLIVGVAILFWFE